MTELNDPTPDWLMERLRDQQFNLAATTPGIWAISASQLKHAADHLFETFHIAQVRDRERWLTDIRSRPRNAGTTSTSRRLEGQEAADFEDRQLLSSYFLLAGLALENICKAILVARKEIAVTADGKVVNAKTHDLVQLFRRCQIVVSEEEANLLFKLSTFVEWMGKYPVPLAREKMWPIRTDAGWQERGESIREREIQGRVDALFNKAAQVYVAWRDVERADKAP